MAIIGNCFFWCFFFQFFGEKETSGSGWFTAAVGWVVK